MKSILLLLTLAPLAVPATAPRAGYADTIARTSEFVRKTMAERGLVGVSVALVDGEEVVWQQGFGFADRARAIPVTGQTVFHIASVSKVVTTTAILMLVDDGKISLDAPVTRYLPRFRLAEPGFEKITVRMLLTHQSGMPGSYYGWASTTAPVLDFNRRMMDWLAEQGPQYPPGYVSIYTNNGFSLLDEIVTVVSGKPFAQFVHDRIAVPLGMTQTGIDWMDPTLETTLSKGYVGGEEQPREYINVAGTGGFSSTPADLCRLLAMFNGQGTAFGRTLLKPETIAEMNRDQTTHATVQVPGAAVTPGLGWDHYADPALAYAGAAPTKNGGSDQFGSQILILPKYKLGAAATANSDDGAAVLRIVEQAVMNALEERYGVAPPPDLKIGDPTPAGFDLQTLSGTYSCSGFGGICDLKINGSALEIWLRSGDSYGLKLGGLTHREEGWFANDQAPGTQFGVQKLGGRDVLLVRATSGHSWTVSIVGERVGPAPALSDAWKARLNKTYVAVDLDIANLHFGDLVPGLRLAERDGRMVYELLAKTPAPAGLFGLIVATPPAPAVKSSRLLEPTDDVHAWTPTQIDCNEFTHLHVVPMGKEEWLRVHTGPTLWRPLDGIPEADGYKSYVASIAAERTEWVKLPAGSDEYILTAPETVHWVLYDENLQPFFETWGGGWRLSRPARSNSSALYLALHSLTDQKAAVERVRGRTFSAATGVQRLSK